MKLERKRSLLLVLSYLGFVSLGLPDGLLGVAWPSVRASFGLPLDALLVTSTSGYVLSSFLSGRILARVTIGTLLAVSCLLTAVSLLGYSIAPAWSFMVALGTLADLGAGTIDAGINTYVATHHSARMLNVLSIAGATVSLFWGGLLTGRVLAAATQLGARPRSLLSVCTVAVTASALALAGHADAHVDMIAAAMLGCACGPIFPSLIATTPARVGSEHAANAIGFQVASAALGQSLLPASIGVSADARGLETIATSIVVLPSL